MPFAEYKDFDDCVKRNQDKEKPEAYCAAIMRQVEEKKKASMIFEKFQDIEQETSGDKVADENVRTE